MEVSKFVAQKKGTKSLKFIQKKKEDVNEIINLKYFKINSDLSYTHTIYQLQK